MYRSLQELGALLGIGAGMLAFMIGTCWIYDQFYPLPPADSDKMINIIHPAIWDEN